MHWEKIFSSQSYQVYLTRFDVLSKELPDLGSFLDDLSRRGERVVNVFPNIGTTAAAFWLSSAGVKGLVVVTHTGRTAGISQMPDLSIWRQIGTSWKYRVYHAVFDDFDRVISSLGYFLVKLEMSGEQLVEIFPNVGTTVKAWLFSSAGVNGVIVVTRISSEA